MKATNEVYYNIYALGEFGSLDKLVYNNWQVLDFNPDEVKGQLMCGLDFGYTNDPTAFVASILD
jgi:phage terminase large subunit